MEITPMLQQAIHLLQLSTFELQELLQKELEENPLLEEAPSDDQPATDAGLETPEPGDLPFNVAEVLFGPPDDRARVARDPRFPPVVRTPTSLADHLGEQLRLMTVEPAVRIAAEQIIGNVDDDGYLQATVEEIAEQRAIPLSIVEAALRVVQEFDPGGVAARDLRECLLNQLRDPARGPADPVAIEMVERHLEALQEARYPEIARALAVGLERVMEGVRRISALESKPGGRFAPVETHYVVPDVLVKKVGDDYAVILNEDGMSRLRINSHYRNVGGHTYETQQYLEDRLRSAVRLIKSVQQRQKTLYRVTRSIVRFQREFLDNGPAHLRLLSLREVAEDVTLHEATVCRVTTSKFVETPQGIFPLTFFFMPVPDPDDLPDGDDFPDGGEDPPDPDGPAPAPPVATAAAGSGPGLERTDARGRPYRVAAPRVVKIARRR